MLEQNTFNKKHLFMLVGFLIISFIFIFGVIIFNIFFIQKIPTSQPKIDKNNYQELFTITGIVRTSGLTQEEKKLFKLTDGSYQVTELDQNKYAIGGLFLEGDMDFASYINVCVAVTGTIDPRWVEAIIHNSTLQGRYTYDRFAMNVTHMATLGLEYCTYTLPGQELFTGENKTLTGTILTFSRPAPDIAYDYVLITSHPNTLESEEVILVPQNYQILSAINEGVGQKITVSGTMQQGYAESQYLHVTRVTNVK
ncbi:hypothetical protein KC726_02020 [Candidatus Woesebacteria bacterium]|nr:hypothetical protein [Candidatus Woesebacteria bacterium]